MRNISKTLGFALVALMTLFASCNEESSVNPYIDYGTLAITDFSLRSSKQTTGVDSVYFTIDLRRGVIYNADSLKPGAKIDKLVTNISYKGTMDSVLVIMEGGTTRTGRLDYKANPTDSIDYTGRVTILLKGSGLEKKYDVKLNVHKQYADSLHWNETAVRRLPSRMESPLAQKTVMIADPTALSIIREADGRYSAVYSNDAFASDVTRNDIEFPFTPRIESLTAADGTIYMLDTDNNLWSSENRGETWSQTGQVWDNIIGPYLNTIVGLRTVDGKRMFAQYPLLNLNQKEIPADFPLSGFSNFVTLQNKWTLSPVAFFAGGLKADNSLSGATWAFDGSEWIVLNDDNDLPAMEQPSIIPYYYYRRSSSTNYNEFKVWMLIGGRKADNSVNRTVYISYDNGVNWTMASTQMQLPEAIPAMWGCDNIVVSEKKSANLSDNWTVTPTSGKPARISYELDGEIITWDCPYIYLIGGYGPDGRLFDTIWRGVLNRMTFVPII